MRYKSLFGGRCPESRRLRRLAGFSLAVVASSAMLAGCDTKKVLAVTDPDVARPPALVGPASLPAYRAGAIGDFGTAYNGGNADVEQVHASALLTDEFINTETFPTRIEIDQRAITLTNTSLNLTYYDLQRARVSSERAAAAYAQYAANASDSTGIGEVLALGGMTYVLFAENYCGSVPMSTPNPDGTFTFGKALSKDQLLDSAVSKFNQAIATKPPASIKNLASVGLGRALLDKGDFAGAAAAVASVPPEFQYLYVHDATSNRQNNATWSLTVSVARFGEANNEGGNGLPFQSDGNVKTNPAPDPRVADSLRNLKGSHVGFDNATQQYIQMKYPDRGSPIVVADGVEAQLIKAEAQLHAGDPVAALATLNALRSNSAVLGVRGYSSSALPALTLQPTTAEQVDQLFKERAYWLYLTSHRLGDMRRLITQYGRGPETVFATGTYFKGGTYGPDVNIPVPFSEQNNPNYDAAAAAACDVAKA
jgi:starch-binding outer membrane protein, SusD/RagB family